MHDHFCERGFEKLPVSVESSIPIHTNSNVHANLFVRKGNRPHDMSWSCVLSEFWFPFWDSSHLHLKICSRVLSDATPIRKNECMQSYFGVRLHSRGFEELPFLSRDRENWAKLHRCIEILSWEAWRMMSELKLWNHLHCVQSIIWEKKYCTWKGSIGEERTCSKLVQSKVITTRITHQLNWKESYTIHL